MPRLLLALLLTLAAFPALAWPDEAVDMLSAINEVRRDHGLKPLQFEDKLGEVAQSYAQELAEWGRLSHQGPKGSSLVSRLDGRGYPFRLAAENLASGLIGPKETVGLWMNSAGHRDNLLKPEMNEAGVGMFKAKDGQTYWTLLLGRRLGDRSETVDYAIQP